MRPVDVVQGTGPVVLSFPHSGTYVPDDIWVSLTPRGQALSDTDWFVDRLYDGLLSGATTVRANFHRYVIDANRDPSGESLYPGQNTTGLVPFTDFDGAPIWSVRPDAEEISARQAAWHAPYHAALQAELERVKALHGLAVLYDCHSIRPVVPYLFEWVLPDFNIGTNNGVTCDDVITESVARMCGHDDVYTMIVNGRFRGGWTTRHYGDPERDVHAIQMELSQSTYLRVEEASYVYDTEKAEKLRVRLANVLRTVESGAMELKGLL